METPSKEELIQITGARVTKRELATTHQPNPWNDDPKVLEKMLLERQDLYKEAFGMTVSKDEKGEYVFSFHPSPEQLERIRRSKR